MASQLPKYLHLHTLVNDWAHSSGQPSPLVIRRIGEWALMGGFASDAFIHENGTVISRIDMHASCIAVAESSPYSDGRSHAAAGALVRKSDVLEFCRSNDVRPPKSLVGSPSLFRSMFQADAKHDAPPPCPRALERAEHLHSENWAAGALDTLTNMLNGDATGFMETAATATTTEFGELALSRWSRYVDMAQGFINQGDHPELQARLNGLIAEWDEASRRAKADSLKEAQGELAVASVHKPVVLGRPKGSPLAAADDIIVEEIREIFLNGGLSVTAIALKLAKKMAGTGEVESKVKRVSNAYFKKYPRPT